MCCQAVGQSHVVRFNDVVSTSGMPRGYSKFSRMLARKYMVALRYYREYAAKVTTGRPDPRTLRAWKLWEDIDKTTGGWLTLTQGILAQITKRNDSAVIAVSSDHILNAAASLLLYNLNPYFDLRCVYSTAEGTFNTTKAMQQVMDRFGPDVVYVAIGNTTQFQEAASEAGMPFVPLQGHEDAHNLLEDLQSVGSSSS
uniref:protein-tyrosine-phosphatase n=1 Tax=Lotharella oceanica TaxID=641309 RepID=A0A7S2TUB5_9EUKA|mmetsp:Transcript_29905/g.55911  ORF Transcript_29905/g.55911 Transcript_29905/m.55911 type:complete len:198 (+) Transcript_29905:6-599(+)